MNATRTPTSAGAGASGASATLQFGLVFGFAALVAAAYGALRAGHALSGPETPVPGNPFQALIEVTDGTLVWPFASALILIAAAAVLVSSLIGLAPTRRRAPRPTTPADERWLIDGPEVALSAPVTGKTFALPRPPGAVFSIDSTPTAGRDGGDAA
ncbi:hypothetical protein [Rhodococcoides kroppenstedtii]|uniref:hypothetical protein n=1 Tax=Rhodococcoides kroppenstedtii TaxID=293050 RepID=UPI00362AD8DA